VLAAERLREIYNAQRIARDQTTSLSEVCTQRRRCSTGREGPTLAEIEVALLQSPRRLRVGGQGFRLSYKERVAIEDRAMVRAQAWLEAQGYSVKDTHLNSPFDYEARRDGACLKVEVKGTTADVVDALFMTRNEVDLHRVEKSATALIIVSKIRLSVGPDGPVAGGGEITPLIGWDIDGWETTPIAFQVRKKLS